MEVAQWAHNPLDSLILLSLLCCTMADQPFNAAAHVTAHVQEQVGLHLANCATPRNGDRTNSGVPQGHASINCFAHMKPLSTTEAARAFEMIAAQHKNAPATVADATIIAKLARNGGGIGISQACSTLLLDGDVEAAQVAYYWSPGSPLCEGKTVSSRFISFLYTNQDDGHRVVWCELTGREQFEWFNCWVARGRTFERREEFTRGLKGTDLDRITDVAGLRTALTRSPSLSRRRPANHAVPANDWNGLVRQLFPPLQAFQLP